MHFLLWWIIEKKVLQISSRNYHNKASMLATLRAKSSQLKVSYSVSFWKFWFFVDIQFCWQNFLNIPMRKTVENISKFLLPKLFGSLTLGKLFFLRLSQFIEVLKRFQFLQQILEEIRYFHDQLVFSSSLTKI